ncbi:MAG: T9SS type A sorting domain-containing protein, partial [Bacteroidales bacterium]
GNILVYPNPFKTELTIDVQGGIGLTHFKLYNSLGQVVTQHEWDVTTSSLYKIDVSKLAAGTYFYRIVNNGTTTNGKITKE